MQSFRLLSIKTHHGIIQKSKKNIKLEFKLQADNSKTMCTPYHTTCKIEEPNVKGDILTRTISKF